MTYEQAMLAVLADPESDDARRDLVAVLRGPDPDRARYVELQMETTLQRREEETFSLRGSDEEWRLQSSHRTRWKRDVDMYLGEHHDNQRVEFERGLPWLISMNPYLFLEQGEYVMSRIAPLRGISFFDDPDGSPFPMKELAASPLLERLEEIRFLNATLTADDVMTFSSSTRLTRAYTIDMGGNVREASLVEGFAANPATRKCLAIRGMLLPDDYLEEYSSTGEPGPDYYQYWEMSECGHALERKYGYLPWLHLNHLSHAADAKYWTDQKVLPRFVPGSPADAPVPYGRGCKYDPEIKIRRRVKR